GAIQLKDLIENVCGNRELNLSRAAKTAGQRIGELTSPRSARCNRSIAGGAFGIRQEKRIERFTGGRIGHSDAVVPRTLGSLCSCVSIIPVQRDAAARLKSTWWINALSRYLQVRIGRECRGSSHDGCIVCFRRATRIEFEHIIVAVNGYRDLDVSGS